MASGSGGQSTSAKSLQEELNDIEGQLEDVNKQITQLREHKARLADRKVQLERSVSSRAAAANELNGADWDQQQCEWTDQLNRHLRDTFKLDSFRPKQLSAINASMSGEDVLLIMSTGGGKSLTYQLPAVVEGGVTLVVSPLLSLMHDQVYQMTRLGVKAALLAQSTTKEELNDINAALVDAKGKLRLLYVTPEKLAKSKRVMAKLEQCNAKGLLKRLVIDEVHCCSQWGHDFRPDYKFLNVLKRQFPKVPLMGLTATAGAEVLDDVKEMLGCQAALVFRAPFNRPELQYSVREKPSGKLEMVDELVTLINTSFRLQSGIIYVYSRKEAETLANDLRSRGIKARNYHADMAPVDRTLVHEAWLLDTCQVIVATVAFGMGIDKPNVRFVIHHTLAKSIESYYQESGRAGRDGQPARCILYYRLADVFRQSTMVCTTNTGLPKLYAMLAYCLCTDRCRRAVLAEHFNETYSAEWCQGNCDICKSSSLACHVPDNCLQHLPLVLDCLKAQKERVTAAKLLDYWQKQVKTKTKMFDQCGAERVLAELLMEGYIREDFHFTPFSIISYILPTNKKTPEQRLAVDQALQNGKRKNEGADSVNHKVIKLD